MTWLLFDRIVILIVTDLLPTAPQVLHTRVLYRNGQCLLSTKSTIQTLQALHSSQCFLFLIFQYPILSFMVLTSVHIDIFIYIVI